MRKALYEFCHHRVNPLLQPATDRLMATDFADLETLKEIQLQRLRDLLKHASQHAPFYKERLAGLDFDRFQVKDLAGIEPIQKRDLIESNHLIQNYPAGEKLIKSSTSGSTGEPLVFKRAQAWDAAHRAAQSRGYAYHNRHISDKSLYFWGFFFDWKLKLKLGAVDFIFNRRRFFSYDEKTMARALKYLRKCRVIEGYSSSIFMLAKYVVDRGLRFDNVEMVKGTSEKIFPAYQEVVQKAFGCRMISEYGAAESGIMAFECPEGHMHIVQENVVMEEEDGQLLVTNLFSHSFPIIRYRIGDMVRFADENQHCPCGRKHPILLEVTGRIGKPILGREESFASLVLYYIFKSLALHHNLELPYFARQEKKGELQLRIIGSESDRDRLVPVITQVANQYFKGDIDLQIQFVQDFGTRHKKVTDFETTLA